MSLNLSRLHEYPVVSVDVETTGLHWYRDKMFGVAVAAYDGKQIVSDYWDIRERPAIMTALRAELPKCERIINHNMKFDAQFLINERVKLPMDRLECTSVRAALINEHERSFSLDSLCKKYELGAKVEIYEDLARMFGGKATREVQMKNLHRAPVSLAKKYAIADPKLAIHLWLWQEEEIRKQELERVWELERRLMPILIDMERGGVSVDVDRTRKAMKDTHRMIDVAQRALVKAAGRSINANSPKQIRDLLQPVKGEDGRWRVKGVLLESTDTGAPSFDADALRALAGRGIEMAKYLHQVRKLTKALSFLKDHILGHEIDGKVYPNYNQTKGDNDLGTGTGRFSINDPALQQIPSRDVDIASIVRACFIPDEAWEEWACADWEQFEFRWFAHYASNERLLQAYRDDPSADFHQMVADLTGIPRKPRFAGDANAKQINLGLVFGMGQGKMASEMGLPYTIEQGRDKEYLKPGPEAIEVFNKYHAAIPGVKALLEQASSIARSRGYVITAMGRHIRFPGGQFTHKAGGLVFQGTSADCMKQKMIEMHPIAKREGFKMLLSVHDELDFSIPAKIRKRVAPIIKRTLETFDGEQCPIKCKVPILSSVAFGPNWWEASK